MKTQERGTPPLARDDGRGVFLTVWMAIYSFPSIEGHQVQETHSHLEHANGMFRLSHFVSPSHYPIMTRPKFHHSGPNRPSPRPAAPWKFQVFGGPPNPLANLGPGCTRQLLPCPSLLGPWPIRTSETNPTLVENLGVTRFEPECAKEGPVQAGLWLWTHTMANSLTGLHFAIQNLVLVRRGKWVSFDMVLCSFNLFEFVPSVTTRKQCSNWHKHVRIKTW